MRAARAEVIARLTALRRLVGLGKVPVTIERAERHLRDTGRPLIIMGHHEEALDSIESALSTLGFRVGTITGKVTGKARQRAVDEFQLGTPANKPPEKRKYLDVLVCSITAAGVGLTLTRAQDMIIFERVWRPFDLVQAEDRIHRYGQENKVVITYLDAAGTIDDKLAALLAEKAETAGQVLDGADLDEDEAQDRVVRDMFGQLTESMQSNPEVDLDAAMFDWANPDVG
jgi:SNF2 family DNA or RNA helicase